MALQYTCSEDKALNLVGQSHSGQDRTVYSEGNIQDNWKDAQRNLEAGLTLELAYTCSVN